MNFKKIVAKQLIASDSDQKAIFTKKYKYQQQGLTIEFTVDQLSALEDLEGKIPPDVFKTIQSELNINKGLISYKSAEGLKMFAKYTEKQIVLISAGEYQSNLYKVFIEAVYENL